MSKKVGNPYRGNKIDNNFSKATSMIQHHSHVEMQPPKLQHLCSYINDVLHPSSIFSPYGCSPALDNYLKIKMKDKPKDSLLEIQQKKQAFNKYVDQQKPSQPILQTEQNQNSKKKDSRMKQQYSQFTFHKNSKENMLLFIRIVQSRRCKCNISIVNLLGQIYKYYPNVFLSKKEGKIMKFVCENKDSFIFVYDYTNIESSVKTFPSLLNEARFLYYEMVKVDISNQQRFNLSVEKIHQAGKGKLIHRGNNIIIMSNEVFNMNSSDLLKDILARVKTIETQQEQFLNQFRGIKPPDKCNLAFDMMVVNLWRQFKWTGKELVNEINQLFIIKEKQMDQMIFQDTQVLHTPKRLRISQNCSLCLSKNKEVKRPRRTFWICTSCSAQKQKPIYLCKGCFKNYHTNNDVHLYRKNEKKTKTFKKKLRNKIKKHLSGVKQEDRRMEQEVVTERDRNLMELDKKCDQFFGKFDELVEERSFISAEYYLQMLMNMAIIKTQEYLNKIQNKEQNPIKLQEK